MKGLVLLLGLLVMVPAVQGRGGRLRPPDFVTCDRNHLTVFSGVVTAVVRGEGPTRLRLDSDEDTHEEFTLGEDPGRFRVRGKAFGEDGWQAVLQDGKAREGLRATVWVCDTEKTPLVDWEPPREPAD